ncbi:MAG TPA: lysophospholipid acyltransferase family protein [Candidatus Baltobacteraceae bacterium]|nr:lysophospholipid acyltransferase family protein [Candidatus Baltobacteraceae bacterium]
MTALESGFRLCFERYLAWLLRRSFRGVWIARDAAFPPGGFIAIANHSSWWDGFVPYALQRRVAPQTPFALMMASSQLRRFPYFRLGGAFGVDPARKRAAFASVEHAAASARSGAGVWIFPQGAIRPPYEPLRFARGYLHAARRADVPIVPVAIRLTMMEAQRPDAFVEIGEPLDPHDAECATRAPAAVRALLFSLDLDIARGTVFRNRSSLFERAAGVDDVVSRFAANAQRS